MHLKCVLYCIFVLRIAVTHAAISYRINITRNEADCEITVKGRDVRAVGEQDQTFFKITESELKKYINNKYGRTPTDVYVKNPTPFGTFEKYDFIELRKITEPEQAAILGIESVPVIITTQKLINKSTKTKATFTAAMSQSVETSSESSWIKEGELSVGVEVSYGFTFASVGVSLSYTGSWGEETGKAEAITVGAETGLSVDLKAGEAIYCKMTASRGTLKARVDYKTYLEGQVFANFDPEFNDHRFWGLPISELQSFNDLIKQVISREVISVGFYADADLEIEDMEE